MRKGIVANIHREKGTIILDCPSYKGNSGGIVIEVTGDGALGYSYRTIGVVSQRIPIKREDVDNEDELKDSDLLNSGYSVVVSMDKIFELIGFQKK